jgi:hypothetical protein
MRNGWRYDPHGTHMVYMGSPEREEATFLLAVELIQELATPWDQVLLGPPRRRVAFPFHVVLPAFTY